MLTRPTSLYAAVTTALLLTAVPAHAADHATGTATAESIPLSATVGEVTVNVGTTLLHADTTTTATSRSGMTLLEAAGVPVMAVEAASDGTTERAGATIDEATPAGVVRATLGRVTAITNGATTATADMDRLDTHLRVLSDAGLDVTVNGAAAHVTDTQATATHNLEVADVRITVGGLLGDTLAALPLPTLIALADTLDVAVPGDLTVTDEFAANTVTLVDAVAALTVSADTVDAAAQALADPTTLATDLPALGQQLIDATVAYANAEAAVIAAASDLTGSSTDLAALAATIDTLVADLAGTNLLHLDGTTVTQQAIAIANQADTSSATALCAPTVLTVAGLAPLPIGGCTEGTTAAVADLVNTAAAEVSTVLDTVGAITGDPARIELYPTVTTDVTGTDDGTVTATSHVVVLRVTVPTVTVDLCNAPADPTGMLCTLGTDLTNPALAGLDLATADAQQTAADALTDVAALLLSLGIDEQVAAITGADGTVAAAADAAAQTLANLNLADLGTADGTVINGLTVTVDPTVTAMHTPAAPAVPVTAPAPDPTPDPTPTPEPDPTLPNTGGGAALTALAMLASGAYLRRRTG